MDDNRPRLSFLTDGGAGNLFVQLNFIYCLYRYLKEENPYFIVFGHKSEELNQLLMENSDFVEEYYTPNECNRGYEGDAFIHLEFFPDVLFCKDELRKKSPKAYKLIEVWKTFMKDMQRRYGIMRPAVNYNAYIYAINNSKNVLDVADIDGRLQVGREYSFRLKLDDKEYLESLGLCKDEYITIQRGATPASYKKESTKLWPVRHYEKLIELLKELFPGKKIVQLGEKDNSDVLTGIDINMLGKTSWRELGVVLKNSWIHIDGECGMVHFRRMLTDKPSVVLFGPTPDLFYGYDGNINIRSGSYKNWCARLTDSWSERCMRGDAEPECIATLMPGAVAEKIVAWDKLQSVCAGKEISFKNEELYTDRSIVLEDVHKKDFLDTYKIIHYEREEIKAEELKVFCIKKQGYSFVPLKETAAFKTLNEDCWDDYENYINLLRKKDYNNIHSADRFRTLVSELDSNGYESGIPILIDTQNRILDGQHRAAWFASRKGLPEKISVIRIYRLGDESWDFFPFERITHGCRVIIYGCGAIGESYIKQIDYTHFCELTDLVDKNPDVWNNNLLKKKRIICRNIEEISEFDGSYDYVVIASRGGKNMRDMRNYLLSVGISADRIISYVRE